MGNSWSNRWLMPTLEHRRKCIYAKRLCCYGGLLGTRFPGKAKQDIVGQVQKHPGWGHLHQVSNMSVLEYRVLWQRQNGSHKSHTSQNGLTQASTQRQAYSGPSIRKQDPFFHHELHQCANPSVWINRHIVGVLMSSVHSFLAALENFPATWSRRQGQGGRLPVAYNSNGNIGPSPSS